MDNATSTNPPPFEFTFTSNTTSSSSPDNQMPNPYAAATMTEEAFREYEDRVCAMLRRRGGPGTMEWAKNHTQRLQKERQDDRKADSDISKPAFRVPKDIFSPPSNDNDTHMANPSPASHPQPGPDNRNIHNGGGGGGGERGGVPPGWIKEPGKDYNLEVSEKWWRRNAERYRQIQLDREFTYLEQGGAPGEVKFSYLKRDLLEEFGVPREYHEGEG